MADAGFGGDVLEGDSFLLFEEEGILVLTDVVPAFWHLFFIVLVFQEFNEVDGGCFVLHFY